MRGRAVLILALALTFLSASCAADDNGTSVTVEITHRSGTVQYVAEVAATPARRQRGLMGRESLAGNAGMLFLFPEKVANGFWMKNTLIPLDIAFIDGERIIEIHSMTPCTTDRCPLTTPSSAYDAALEVKEGSFARAGVAVGDRVAVNGSLPKVS